LDNVFIIMRNRTHQNLKEEKIPYILKVIKKLEQEKRGALLGWHDKKEIIDFYGLQKNEIRYLIEMEGKALDKLIGYRFNVTDYPEVNIGGYDFEFMVIAVEGNEHDEKEDDYQWEVDVAVLLPGATVELMIADPGTPPLELEAAINNTNYGWEIESEIVDVIHHIIIWEEPILKALGAQIDVDQSYTNLL